MSPDQIHQPKSSTLAPVATGDAQFRSELDGGDNYATGATGVQDDPQVAQHQKMKGHMLTTAYRSHLWGLIWTVIILILLALFAGLAMKLVGKWRQPDTVIGSNTSVLQAPAGNAGNQVVSVNGELKVSGQTTLQNLTVNGTSNLRGDITAGGNLQVAKDANVVGQLTAGA